MWNALFENKQLPAERSVSINRATGTSTNTGTAGYGLSKVGPWDVDMAVKHGMERVTWVFRSVDVIAQNQASVPINIVKGLDRRKFKDTVDDPRIWKLLNFRPNSYENAWQFRYRLTAMGLLSRRGVFVEIVRGRDGRPSELHVLPHTTEPIPGEVDPRTGEQRFVDGYWVTRGDWQRERLAPEDVIWVKFKPHPTDPYQQLTPLTAAGMAAETDFLADLFNRNFLASDGRPGMLITVRGNVSPQDAEEIKRRFGGGPVKAGETTVIEAEGMDVADFGVNPHDLQWEGLSKAAKEKILLAFGVPESVMGNASGRTFDNADAERETFWMDTMIPHCDSIAFAFDVLTGDIHDDVVLGYNYNTVDVLQRAERRRREEWRNEVNLGLRTIDSYFELIGEEPWDVVGTRILWHTSGIAIAKNPEDQAAIMTLKPVGETPEVTQEEQSRRGALRGTQEGMREFGNIMASRAAMLAAKSKPLAIESKREFSEDQRRQAASNGHAMPDGSYPILNEADLKNAIQAFGRAKNKAAVKRHICRRARALGKTSLLPPDWKGAKSNPYVGNEPDVIDAEVVEKTHPYLGTRHRLEGAVEGVLSAWDTTQEKVVVDRLTHVKSRKGTRHWDGATGETKALDPFYAVEVDRWVRDLKDSMRQLLTRAVAREAKYAANDMKNSGVLAAMQNTSRTGKATGTALDQVFGGVQHVKDEALTKPYDAAMSIVEKAARRQSRRVADVIKEMDADGASLKEIEAEVRKMIGTRSPWRKQLATNVVTAAVEGARTAVYSRSRGLMVKQWNAEEDERTRASHRSLDMEEKEAHERFKAGKGSLLYPGDPTGPVEEVANCRCWLEWLPSDKFYEM